MLPNEDSAPFATAWTVLTDFTNDIDLTSHPQGLSGRPARELVVVSGGVVVVEKPNGSAETTPTLLGGFPLAGLVNKIKKASSGTTATAIIVYW